MSNEQSLRVLEEALESLSRSSDLEDLCRDATEVGAISKEVKKSLDSLDPRVPRPRKIRYLLLHACGQMETNPRLFEKWFEVLAKYGVSTSVLGGIYLPDHGRMLNSADNQGSDGKKCPPYLARFSEEQVSALTEVLAGCSGKWRNIRASLNLPQTVEKSIEARLHMYDDKMCLNRVLHEWVAGKHDHAKDPTLTNLKKVLRSKTVGLGKEANQLDEDVLSQQGIDFDIKGSCLEASPLVTTPVFPKKHLLYAGVPPSKRVKLDVDIVSQLLDTTVNEEQSTLLEVQVTSACSNAISYQWLKNGFPLQDDGEHYLGSSRSILCIANACLATEGKYNCEISSTCSESEQQVSLHVSNPVVLTVSMSHFKKVLVDMYRAQPDIHRDTWPPVSTKTYVNLAIATHVIPDIEDNFSRYTIQGDDAFEAVEYGQVFGHLNKGGFVLIEGRPGSGKTTLVHRVSKDWALGKPILKGARLVFHVALRVLSMKANVEMLDILKLFYHDHKMASDALDYINTSNGEGVCFILDGLDECKENVSIVHQLIHKDCLQRSMVIVSSRPCATVDLRPRTDTYLEVVGFQRKQVYEYIEQYPFACSGASQELIAYLNQHPSILHMCYLPVHVAMLSFLHDRMKGNLPCTKCGIYTYFTMLTLLRKECHKVRYQPLKSPEDLSGDKREVFMRICKLAFEMTLSRRLILIDEELSLSDSKTKIDDPSLGLVTMDFTAGLYGYQNLYTFVHLTFQEYLSAYYISSLEEHAQREIDDQNVRLDEAHESSFQVLLWISELCKSRFFI